VRESVKQRIVGAVVLIALGVIFIPFLFTLESPRQVDTESMIPPAPDIEPLVVEEPQREQGFIPPKPMDEAFMPSEPATPEESAASSAPGQDFVPAEPVATGSSATPAEAPQPPMEVVEERPALAGDTVGAWVIQVASIRKKEDAEVFSSRLRDAGHKAYVRSAQVQGGVTYRVFVGPVAVRAQAESDKTAIDKGFGVQSLIVRFEP